MRVLLVVFDGLRPDMIRPETTPNLVRFAAQGTRMPGARSVFPSETRVCTASVATGCHPRRHGIAANAMFHPRDPARTVATQDAASLRAMEQDIGGPAVLMPGLSDLLAAAGRSFAVFSSGSTGQTFVLAPSADAHGQVVVSGHGPAACSRQGQAVLARLPAPPSEPGARAVWIADAWRTTMLPSPPDASVLWLCEPDTSAHYKGLDTPAQREVLTRADAAFGRILDDWHAGPHHDTLQIIVASDHGHITVSGHVDEAAAFAESPVFADCHITGGGIVVPGGERERVIDACLFLMRQDWIGSVFAVDVADLPHGVLPRGAVLADGARAGHVLYTLRHSAGAGLSGLAGTTLLDTASRLEVGAGTHGGLHPGEMRTVLMLAGQKIRAGHASDWPCGLIDIAPTILALLGLEGAEAMDGRVLTEALEGFGDPAASRSPETWEAMSLDLGGVHYAQRVARVRVGRHVWVDHGGRL